MLVTFLLSDHNLTLKTSAIAALCKFYTTRQKFVDLTKNLMVIQDPDSIKLFMKAKSEIVRLNELCEESETWLSEKI